MITQWERPWGGFEQFVHNEAVTVKIITVALASASLQSHTAGRAVAGHRRPRRCRGGGKGRALPPVAALGSQGDRLHRLGNSGTTPVRVLEIAFGHFDEEDIERLVDDYNRVTDLP